jgi:hypothetical protein
LVSSGLHEQFARIGKALASGRRLELLELLAQRERNVEDLARLTAMSVANTSQHLQVLRVARAEPHACAQPSPLFTGESAQRLFRSGSGVRIGPLRGGR